jgi:hypothetical protein
MTDRSVYECTKLVAAWGKEAGILKTVISS